MLSDSVVLWNLLRDVSLSGVEFEDERIGYVVVQIDRDTWEQIKEMTRV